MYLPAFDIQRHFASSDWLIVGGWLALTLVVGLLARPRGGGVEEFFLAGRRLRTELGVMTVVATELGVVAVLYAGREGYLRGFASFHAGLAMALGMFAVGISGFVIVPLRRLGVMTIPEFYELRFGRGHRVLGGIILAAAGVLKTGLILYAGGVFLMIFTGVTDLATVRWILTGVVAVAVLYTVVGGMVSVLVTDYFQFIAIALALLLAALTCMQHRPLEMMFEVVFDVNSRLGEAGSNPFHSGGAGKQEVLGMLALGVMFASAWPPVVQRASAARSPRVVKQMFSLGAVGMLIRTIVPALLGVMAFAAVHEPNKVHLPAGISPWDAMPLFLRYSLPAGLVGIVAAGTLSALMSTIDSYLLCWSTVLTQDVLAPCLGERLSARGRIAAARGFIVLLAGGVLITGLWWPLGKDLWDQLALAAGAYFAGAVPVLVLGLYWRRASRFGAYLALGAGLGALAGAAPILRPLQRALGWDVQAQTVAVAAVAASVLAMVAGSLLVPDRQPKVLAFPQDDKQSAPRKTE